MGNDFRFYSKPITETRTFSVEELADIFNTSERTIHHIKQRLGIKKTGFKHREKIFFTTEEYIRFKNYVDTHKVNAEIQEKDEPIKENKHELVTDKRFLNLATFPSYEEITPRFFLDMGE